MTKAVFPPQERDGYKGIIEQYERDTTLNLGTATVSRTQQLEGTVTAYQGQVDRLETELARSVEQLADCKARAHRAENQLAQLQSRQQLQKRTSLDMVDQKLIAELR